MANSIHHPACPGPSACELYGCDELNQGAPPADNPLCAEPGYHHSWHPGGLDVPDTGPLAGTLVSIKRCVWCGKEQRATYKGRAR